MTQKISKEDLDNDTIVLQAAVKRSTDGRVISSNADIDNSDSPELDERTVLTSNKPSSSVNSYDLIRVGSIIKGRFRLNKRLGEGGMGCVYLAEDKLKLEAKSPDPFVAIKILSGDFQSHPAAFVSLQRETQKSQQLAHPNIITAYDFDRDDDIIYMTMEALRGDDLDQHIYDDRDRQIDTQLASDIVTSISSGLAYAHSKGVIHSDLKPANIFLTENNTAKILDFGIARAFAVAGSENNPVDSFDAGELGALTRTYASCEMFEGGDPSPADDIYALGIIAYQLFTGDHPFNKLTAIEAREKKLKPKFHKNINRYQWRAIQLALKFDGAERAISVDDFIRCFDGPSRLKQSILALSMMIMLGLAYFYYYSNYLVIEHVAFSDLSEDKRNKFNRQFEESELSSRFGDHNAAIFHLNNAFNIHPFNKKVMKSLGGIVDTLMLERIDLMNSEDLLDYHYKIKSLLEYDALSDNVELKKRLKDIEEMKK